MGRVRQPIHRSSTGDDPGATGEDGAADVVVIGAGAAGLAASRRLAEAGRSVLLLEARDRLGGRIWTVERDIEIGAEFVHGRPEPTLALLREAGIGLVQVAGEQWSMRDGELGRTDDRVAGAMRELLERAARVERDISVAGFLDGAVGDDPASRAAAARIRAMTEGFDAADPERASIKALAAEWADGSTFSSGSRPVGGYGALIDYLARSLDPALVEIRLESVVKAVHWRDGGVEIEVEEPGMTRAYRARHALVTLPLGVLQAPPGDPAAVRFEPPLDMKRGALAGLAMGPTHRVVLRFRDAFWEKLAGGRMRDAGFFLTTAMPFRTFWTQLPERRPELVAWVGGPSATRVGERGGGAREGIIEQAIESVDALFAGRPDVRELLDEVWFHDWTSDSRSRGSYSYTTVGGADARSELAKPVAGTLFFAGEATDESREATTVAGAVSSGEIAAAKIIGTNRP